MLYRGPLYRALNPIYAREPLSGRGAELYGGRFNPKGVPALYSSLTVMTALGKPTRRAASSRRRSSPTTRRSTDVFDCRDEEALKAEGMDAAALADTTWRDQMKATGEARTQSFARRLMGKGFRALLVRSFAPGATETDLNLVLWDWGASPPSRLTLIDDENRLSR